MNKKLMITNAQIFALAIITLSVNNIAQAEIYKQVDAQGRVTYSNVKIKGATKLDIEAPASSFGSNEAKPRDARTKTPTPNSFPKVDSQTQNQRDSTRKSILQSELEAEKKALDDAKQSYEDGASNPEVFKTKDGKTFRNVAKFDEKMKSLQAEVDAHQRNIELLQKEINATN